MESEVVENGGVLFMVSETSVPAFLLDYGELLLGLLVLSLGDWKRLVFG